MTLMLIVTGVGLAGIAHRLSSPAKAQIGEAPATWGAESVRLSLSGADLRGWALNGRPGAGAVLLLHGVRGNRTTMMERAERLRQRGLAVLLMDLPAHGESGGARIGFGALEGDAVRAAWAELHRRWPNERHGFLGMSPGAASFVLADVRPRAQAVVLESMYPTLRDAVRDRLGLHLGEWARPLEPLLTLQLPMWIGQSVDDLRPIDHLKSLQGPLLIASGSEDRHTLWRETEALHAQALAPKRLWKVHGAAHEDLLRFDPNGYATEVFEFLSRQLHTPNP